MTAIVLWSGYVPTWALVTGSGPAIVMFWWLVGMIVFGALWLATQPLFQKGRGRIRSFVPPRWRGWRIVNLHRTNRATEPRRDAS